MNKEQNQNTATPVNEANDKIAAGPLVKKDDMECRMSNVGLMLCHDPRLPIAATEYIGINMIYHQHIQRLDRIWADNPIFFITICTKQRQSILADAHIAKILIQEWQGAYQRHGWAIGYYMIMPDHIHFFCMPIDIQDGDHKQLSTFIQQWKQLTSKYIKQSSQNAIIAKKIQFPIWQPNFFDHLLRSQESYEEKLEYVQQNPVRLGLVQESSEWPWQGAIYDL